MKNNIEEDIKLYKKLKKGRTTIANIDKDYFFNFVDSILADRDKYKQLYDKALEDVVQAERKLNKKDNTIEKMAEFISNTDKDEDICKEMEIFKNCEIEGNKYCKKCGIRYFEKKSDSQVTVK